MFSAVAGRMKSFGTHQAAAKEASCPTRCKCSGAKNCEVTSQAWRPGPKGGPPDSSPDRFHLAVPGCWRGCTCWVSSWTSLPTSRN